MKDFNALKDIWSTQLEGPKISPQEVLSRVKKSKSELTGKLLREAIAMTIAISALSFVWLTFSFKLWTSHLAVAIFIICCIYVVFAQYRDYRRMTDSSFLLDKPDQFITYLKSYKRSRYVLNTQKYRIYTILFSIGFLLLFVEIFFIANFWLTLVGILFTIGWLLLCYYVLMKRYIQREERKLEDMILNLERVENQFKDETADL